MRSSRPSGPGAVPRRAPPVSGMTPKSASLGSCDANSERDARISCSSSSVRVICQYQPELGSSNCGSPSWPGPRPSAARRCAAAAVRPRRRPAPRAASLGNDAEIRQFGQLRREQRARRQNLVLFVVGPRDLPIPAGIGQFELRFAELAGAATFLARLRHVSDDGAQIDFEPAFEHVFRVAPIILRQQQGGDQQKQETQSRGGEKQPPGD